MNKGRLYQKMDLNQMWPKRYKDYPVDEPLKKEVVEPGKGIVGVEMHDINGWGLERHVPRKRKTGLLARLFGRKKREQ